MSYFKRPLRIGTRGSPLALVQANYIRDQLSTSCAELSELGTIDIVPIQTSGDRVQDKTLNTLGGKGLFTKEIDSALHSSDVDIAVHSMKDMPTVVPAGLVIGCVLPRQDPRDALITRTGESYLNLPDNAVIGTASLRRRAQALAVRPDMEIVPLRGNVDTRLAKLKAGLIDATFLAVAGLKRLGRTEVITQVLSADDMVPAVAQGAIAVTCRSLDDRILETLHPLNHSDTEFAVTAERAFLRRLDGSCQTPIAALAEVGDGGLLKLSGLLAAPDGARLVRGSQSGRASLAGQVGDTLAERLLAEAGPDFLAGTG